MQIDKIFNLLTLAEKLKCNTRHSYTSTGRLESVAEHSFRLAIFAYSIQSEFPTLNINRVILMCLFHDLGEAVTGDIPTFLKTTEDESVENKAIEKILEEIPENLKNELFSLYQEMEQQKTAEAKLFLALDKMEAVLQHNEADIKTWIPLEYDLQKTHGIKESEAFEITKKIREYLLAQTEEKIGNESLG